MPIVWIDNTFLQLETVTEQVPFISHKVECIELSFSLDIQTYIDITI